MSIKRWPRKRRRFRRWSFASAILAMMVSLFTTTLFWPSPPTVSRLIARTAANEAPHPTDTHATVRPSAGFSCKVTRVTDGDTLRCADGTRVRLHAVSARESDETCSPGHPCPSASAASAARTLTEIVEGKTLSCEKVGTSYNRITAVCWTPANTEVNCAMIQSGTAMIWDRFNRQRAICRS